MQAGVVVEHNSSAQGSCRGANIGRIANFVCIGHLSRRLSAYFCKQKNAKLTETKCG